jgi:ABC-type metal ion transport system substrate-binding protein
MSYAQDQFTIRKRSKVPLIAGIVVLLALIAIAAITFTQRAHQTVVFGDTLKVHFEPAMAGEQKLIEYVSDHIAPDYGIKLEAVGLQDPAQADRAVAEGTYAGTIYQHQWWLKQVVDANGFALTPTLPVFQWGFGIYSDRYTNVKDLPDGATILVPNDGANQAQALWLLQRIGLIGLDKNVEPRVAKLRDVSSNPHHFAFKELDLLSEPRVLDSVDAAIGYTAQFDAGKVPRSKGILFPHAPRTFASQLVIGTKYLGDPQIAKLQKAFSDPRVRKYLETTDDPLVHGVLTPVSDS